MQFNRAFFRKSCKKVEAVITLELIDWVNLDKSDDNSAYVSFLNKFREMYNKNIPTKTIQLKYRVQKSCRNPWLSKDLLKSIRTKAKL